MDSNIHFEPLDDSHSSLMHQWFNQIHVKSFYSLRDWTLEEVQEKLKHLSQKQIYAFIIHVDQNPIGYIQYYPVKANPREIQELTKDFVKEAAGFDLFIGEKEYLRRGFGAKIVNDFLQKFIWPSYRYCIVDPDIRNTASLRFFQKMGFQKHKEIKTNDALKRDATLLLMIKHRPHSG